MKGNGNSLSTLIQKLYFYILPTAGLRTRYIRRHKEMFRNVGEKLFFQPRKFPSDPEFISFGNNVKVSANVRFINHDVSEYMLNNFAGGYNFKFPQKQGCIAIGDNVMIGSNVLIMPDVKIGNNIIIGAGAIVTKDIPDNSVAAGVPCKVVGTFEDFVEKRKQVKYYDDVELYWEEFEKSRE